MRSLHEYPYLPPGWHSHRDGPFTPPPPRRGGIVEGIVYIVMAVVEYWWVVEAVVAIASVAYSLKNANDQRKEALRNQFETVQRNARRNFRQPLTPRRILFGRTRVGGPLVFAHNRSGFETHLLIAIAGHEVHQIESVWMFEEQLPYSTTAGETFGRVSGKYGKTLILWTFLGTSGQDIGQQMRTAVDPRNTPNLGEDISIADVVEATDDFKGIAAIYAVTKAFSVSWEGQSPEFSAIVKGAKLYDPRSSTTAWSRNPALAARHYLVTYMDVDPAHIDADTLEASADVCDELVTLKDEGTESRYRVDGVVTADQSHAEILRTLEQAMAGKIRYSSGIWFIEAGAPKVADEDTPHFTESDVIGPYEVNFDQPDRAFPNAVRGNFFDEVDWQPASFPQYEDATAVAAEGAVNWLEVDLPLTTSYTAAQRIARIMLRRARFRRQLSIQLDLRGLLARPGSLIKFSAPEAGFDATVFEVDGFAFLRDGNRFVTRLDLIEYDPDTYDWDPETDELDMNRGTGTLASIRTRGVKDPYWQMTSVIDPVDVDVNNRVRVDYTIYWDPPEYQDSELQKVTVSIKSWCKTWDGVDTYYEYSSSSTYTANVTNGSGEKEFTNTIVNFTPGEIMIEAGVDVSVSYVQAYFQNNVIGPQQEISPPPPP